MRNEYAIVRSIEYEARLARERLAENRRLNSADLLRRFQPPNDWFRWHCRLQQNDERKKRQRQRLQRGTTNGVGLHA